MQKDWDAGSKQSAGRWPGSSPDGVGDAGGDSSELARLRQANQELVLASLRAVEHQERVTAALDASSTGTFRWDVATGSVECDGNVFRLFGAPADHKLDHIDDLLRLVHPDDRAPLITRSEPRSEHDAVPFEVDVRVLWPDQSVHWLSIAGRTCCEKGGRRIVLGACFDSTERRRAEDERAQHYATLESERRYRTLTDAMPQVVWTATSDGRLEYANERFFLHTGLPRTALGRLLVEVAHPEDQERLRDAWARAVGERAELEAQARLRGRDGSYRWFLVRAIPRADPVTTSPTWLGTCTDIECQKRLEMDLEQASRAKDEFLAMLGHELRNPLAVITAALELMKRKGTLDGVQERGIVERQLRHLCHLVDDLLDVSRITRGTVQLAMEVVSVQSVIAAAMELTAHPFEQRRHELDVKIPPGRLLVRGDKARLAQLVSNLLANAAKYTNGQGHIALRVFRRGDKAVIEVQDDGVGMGAALLPRVFDVFVQGERTLDRSDGGLGVGLAIVKKLTELHGGSVEAFSEGPGLGSLFRVELPVVLDPASASTELLDVGEERGRPLRVLLVDDNLLLLQTSSALVSSFGYTVATAENGPSAIRVAETFRPDVALLDVGLPGMDGLVLASLLRKEHPKLRLVAITGYSQDADRARTVQAGFALHLVKPVDPELLRKVLASSDRID